MKVLLIGNGGREHALAWKLAASPRVTALFVAPGNPGTAQVADNVPVAATDLEGIEKFIRRNGIEFVVIGPEDPLAMGLTDRIAAMGVKVFGPSKEAARIEADKWFAKELMRQQAIPTAEGRSFTDPAAAEEYIRIRDEPMVVKAAGLAKGKGVTVCYCMDDALAAVDQIMRQKVHGQAGARVVIEEVLKGPECSILAFVDRRSIYIMESAQDHKPIGDGDTGPMTGGMGAYSPAPIVTDAIIHEIERDVLVPIVDGLIREGIEYKGVLYAGMMLTTHGVRVLEFNCRFGDPETQPLVMRLKSDLLEVMLAVADGKLDQVELKWDPRPALAVVAASGGYPGKYQSGVPITGINDADAMRDVKVFQAGTKMLGNTLVTDGGRVLAVTALGDTIADAQKRAYQAMEKIHFEGMQYRKDIGKKAINAVTSMIIAIDRLSDPRITPYRNLKDKELDRAGKFFIAEGEHLVRRLLASDFATESVFITEKHAGEYEPLVPAGVPLYVASTEVMNGVLGMKFHSGVIACGRRKPWAPLEQAVPNRPGRLTLVICPDLNNVENIGSIIRLSAGFGVDALILGERCHDPFWRQSIRVSMGTVFTLPIYRSPNLLEDLSRLRGQWGVQCVATVLDNDAEPLAAATRPERLALLFGNEPHGLDNATIGMCDRKVTIPMKLGTDSLNVAVAAGIFLYHFTR